MSTAPAFYLNTSSPIELFEAIKQSWLAPGPGRDIVLIDRMNHEVKFDTRQPISTSSMEMIKAVIASEEGRTKKMIEELAKAWGAEIPHIPDASAPIVQSPENILKRWVCILFYYQFNKDKHDFVETARTIRKYAEDDIIYFRDETAAGGYESDDPQEGDIRIDIDNILDYEPTMSDFKRYIIVKIPL